MRRRTKIIIGIVVLVIAGVLTAGFASRRGKDVTPVTFGKVQRQDLTSKVSANGRIDAKRKVDLSANVMGQVVNLAVREGDVVKKDDFLLQIDQKQLAANAYGKGACTDRCKTAPACGDGHLDADHDAVVSLCRERS